jgi:NTE family protein
VQGPADEIKAQRCKGSTLRPHRSCGDIEFYVVEVKFDALKDEAERMHFKRLPTAFKMPAEEVDKLRDVAHRLLVESEEFQRLLSDLK